MVCHISTTEWKAISFTSQHAVTEEAKKTRKYFVISKERFSFTGQAGRFGYSKVWMVDRNAVFVKENHRSSSKSVRR